MQLSLSTSRAVSLLVACTSDHSQENLTNALITLANIAQNVGSHDLVRQCPKLELILLCVLNWSLSANICPNLSCCVLEFVLLCVS